MAALADVQVPPDSGLLSVILFVGHTIVGPVIAGGVVFTVTGATDEQPPGMVYMMFKVPVVSPETTPKVDTVAMAGLLLDQEPPTVLQSSVVDAPLHTE